MHQLLCRLINVAKKAEESQHVVNDRGGKERSQIEEYIFQVLCVLHERADKEQSKAEVLESQRALLDNFRLSYNTLAVDEVLPQKDRL